MALSFGVEIELLVFPQDRPTFNGFMKGMGWDPRVDSVGPRHQMVDDETLEKRAQNRYAVRFAIAAVLSAAGIPATPKETVDYQSWSILDEESLDEISRYWRVELVSRVLHTNTDWQDELWAVFRLLQQECKLRLTTDCSMHVHVSPGDGKYTAEQLQKICKGLCYFDDAITRIMPAERKDNPWATSNVAGRGSKVNQKLRRTYSQVPTKSWAQLFTLLNKVTPKLVYSLLSGDCDRRYLSWNFENVTESCGTVEFRRPPGVDSAAKAIHWAAFTLGFVARALAVDWAPFESLNTLGSVGELERFIAQGLLVLGPSTADSLCGAIVEDTSPPAVLTPEELGAIERKMKNKDEGR